MNSDDIAFALDEAEAPAGPPGRHAIAFLRDTAKAPEEGLLRLMAHHGPKQETGYRILTAFGLFLHGDVAKATLVAGGLFRAGYRSPLLLDILTRCQIENGQTEDALRILEQSPAAASVFPPLAGRLAVLCLLHGYREQADLLVRRITDLRDDKVKDAIRGQVEKNARYQAMTEAERDAVEDGFLKDVYQSEENQRRGWLQYSQEYSPEKSPYQNPTTYLANLLETTIARLPRPETIIDYGCLYGGFNHHLAERYPGTAVIGYDRSEIAISLNRQAFCRENLFFLSGDFADSCRPFVAGRRALLFHSRTGTLMYPDQLQWLYRTCAELGVARILSLEGVSWSELSRGFVDFSVRNDPSAPLGGAMMLHDYQAYLRTAGYEVEERHLYPMTCHTEIFDPKTFGMLQEAIVATRR